MLRRLLVAAALCAVATPVLHAQLPGLDARVGAYVASPTGDLKDGYEGGYGFYGRFGIPVRTFKLMAAATWTRLNAKGAGGDLDLFTVQAGPHVFLVPLMDVGLEMAYISEAKEFGISPSVSVGFSKLELTASYTTSFAKPATNWLTVGVGIRF